MLRMWRQGYMTVCLAQSHRNITSLPLRNPGWDKSVQSVGLWVLFISVTAVKEASYKCIRICTYPQRYPPKPTSRPSHQIRAKFHRAAPKKSRNTGTLRCVVGYSQVPHWALVTAGATCQTNTLRQSRHNMSFVWLYCRPLSICVCGGTAFGVSSEGKLMSALVSYPLNSPHRCECRLA